MSGERGKARISAQEWETLYRKYLRKLGSYFASQGLHPTEAEDLAHDVFRELGQAKVPEDPKTYIYAIARNILARRRRREFAERAALDEYGRRVTSENSHSTPDPFAAGPATEALSVEAEQILRTAIATLPPKDAELFTLRFMEGLSTKEVAHRMNCSEEAVRKRMERIRAVLRRLCAE
ncbi:MAG: sigma-70 family RNA polymerase sigma factor [Planctomycetes bacterium]|nr:sigma-70 family RNA polymerase sigma factor [Planctomycetota bacterium]